MNVTTLDDDAISNKVLNIESIPAMTITFTLMVRDTARWINQFIYFSAERDGQHLVLYENGTFVHSVLLIINDGFSVAPITGFRRIYAVLFSARRMGGG